MAAVAWRAAASLADSAMCLSGRGSWSGALFRALVTASILWSPPGFESLADKADQCDRVTQQVSGTAHQAAEHGGDSAGPSSTRHCRRSALLRGSSVARMLEPVERSRIHRQPSPAGLPMPPNLGASPSPR